jgi:hypothetical protein
METQLLDGNQNAHEMTENAEHLLADLQLFAEDGLFTKAELRHTRGHVLLMEQIAKDQCSIFRWSWASLMKIQTLVERYRGRIQTLEKQRAALADGSAKQIASS